jgi:hypothetical protein
MREIMPQGLSFISKSTREEIVPEIMPNPGEGRTGIDTELNALDLG